MSDAEPAPLSFWRAVGLTLESTVRNARTCLALVSVYAVLSGVSSAIGGALSLDIDPLRATASELFALVAAGIAGFATFLLVYTFVYPPTLGALSLVGSAGVSGDVLETHGIVRRVFDRALEVIGTFVLTVLILAIVPIAIAVVALLTGLLVGAEAGVVAMLFTLLVLVVPAVYVLVRLSLAVPAVVIEGHGPVGGLRRSWELVGGGAWWWVFGVFAVVGLFSTIAGSVVSAIFSLGNTGIIAMRPGNFGLAALGSAVGAAVSGSFLGVGTGVVYAARAQSRPPAELPLPEPATPETPAPDAAEGEARPPSG